MKKQLATQKWPGAAAFALLLAICVGGRVAADVVAGAVNIVAADKGGRVVAASSEEGDRRGVKPEWRKENLIDGKRVEGGIVPFGSYGWATATAPSPRSPAWAVLAFAQDKTRLIGAVRLDPRTNDPQVIGRWVRNFAIEVSLTTPEGPWERVDSFELMNAARPQAFKFATPVLAKYIRLVITTNHGSNSRLSLGEFEVFEALVQDDELTRIITDLEGELTRLQRLAMSRASAATGRTTEVPAYEDSLIAEKRGGKVLAVSSECLEDEAGSSGEKPKPRKEWRAGNLIDGLIATPGEQPRHESYGWSSNAPPTAEHPEWVMFELPGEHPTVIDAALINTTTRDPWGMMRGARQIEVSVSIAGIDGPWRTVGRWELALEPAVRLLHFPPVEARQVRLTALSNYDSDRYVEAGEFGVYRLSESVDTLGGIAFEFENILVDLKRYLEGDLEAPTADGTDGE